MVTSGTWDVWGETPPDVADSIHLAAYFDHEPDRDVVKRLRRTLRRHWITANVAGFMGSEMHYSAQEWSEPWRAA